jgi:hypothetical protein
MSLFGNNNEIDEYELENKMILLKSQLVDKSQIKHSTVMRIQDNYDDNDDNDDNDDGEYNEKKGYFSKCVWDKSDDSSCDTTDEIKNSKDFRKIDSDESD